MDARYLDVAASLQQVLEDAALQLAGWLRERSGEHDLAMAGGVALNCLMNSRLRDAGIFRRVWVQPAAGDAGTALGAALWTDARERRGVEDDSAMLHAAEASDARSGAVFTLAPRRWQMTHPYLGPAASDDEIEALLKWAKLTYRRVDDVAEQTAQLLAQNKIIGWFQGRMEFGPRALGARSILASPVDPAMQARLNELKDREDFRPVAPAVNVEDLAEWFEPAEANDGASPFMRQARPRCAHPVGAAHRPHRPRADGAQRDQPAVPCAAAGRRPHDRRAGCRQHLLQRARRAHRRHAQGGHRGVLQHVAGRPRHRLLHPGEMTMGWRAARFAAKAAPCRKAPAHTAAGPAAICFAATPLASRLPWICHTASAARPPSAGLDATPPAARRFRPL
jgi:hypothetical protein